MSTEQLKEAARSRVGKWLYAQLRASLSDIDCAGDRLHAVQDCGAGVEAWAQKHISALGEIRRAIREATEVIGPLIPEGKFEERVGDE